MSSCKKAISEEQFICSVCGTILSSNKNLERHVNTVHLNKKIKCLECKATFKQNAQLKTHFKKVHEENHMEKFPCTICNKVYS